jgi:hypothetical protein
MTTHTFVISFGSTERHLGETARIAKWALTSKHFCCPECGEVWARAYFGPEYRHFFATVPCERHGEKYTPGGLLSFDKEYLWHEIHRIPPLILAREIALTIAYYEAYHNDDDDD